jgi:predicted lipid-binding transport protein (Tim44 family)
MNSPIIQLIILAGIAVFLILRLRNVLGTREGFEKPPAPLPANESAKQRGLEVIEGGPDRDIVDHVPEGSESAKALARMKAVDRSFNVGEFLKGARAAYEMILMAFERGELASVKPFLSQEVYLAFLEVIEDRKQKGLTIDANFVGLAEIALHEVEFDEASREADVSIRFQGELTSVVRDASGEIVEGSLNEIKRQKDIWTFSRVMGSDDPNWQLVATGE